MEQASHNKVTTKDQTMKTKLITTITTLTAIAATAADPGTFTAKVTWDYPTNSTPLGFRIYLATGTLPWTNATTKTFSVTNGAATSHNIQVAPGTSYRVAMTAYNQWQETDKSEEAVFSTPALLSIPTNPRVALIVYVP